jgi:iron(III) transport system ATP-binding protein
MTQSLTITNLGREIARRRVLDAITLDVQEGECLVLAGESGSGKTSILRLVGGLDRADHGTIEIGTTLVDDADRVFIPPERRGLGMVFQDFALWPHLSVLENVALAVPRGTNGPARARSLLERFGVADHAGRLPATLSGGQQQRVGIARALAAAPKLLLLDEPFSSLDLETRETLRTELRAVIAESGLTALCVSHDPADCVHLGDRVAVLEAGRISQSATPETLYHRPASAYAARIAGLLGGLALPAYAEGPDALLTLGATTLRLPGRADQLGGARSVRVFWRQAAIVPTEDHDGIAAQCLTSQFDTGQFRATYRVADCASTIPVIAATRPSLGPARLRIDPACLHIFPQLEAR